MLEEVFTIMIGRRNRNKKSMSVNTSIEIIIPEVERVTRYVPIPDIQDLSTTLENSYRDYEESNLVCIHKNGHIYYFLEANVPITDTEWDGEKLRDNI